MKNLFILLVILLTGCNNVIQKDGETESHDSIMHDTVSDENKLNDIINQTRESEDSVKNVEKIEPQLKNNPE